MYMSNHLHLPHYSISVDALLTIIRIEPQAGECFRTDSISIISWSAVFSIFLQLASAPPSAVHSAERSAATERPERPRLWGLLRDEKKNCPALCCVGSLNADLEGGFRWIT